DDLDGRSAQHGITEDPDVHDRHELVPCRRVRLGGFSLYVRQRQATHEQVFAKVTGVGEQDGVEPGRPGSLDVSQVVVDEDTAGQRGTDPVPQDLEDLGVRLGDPLLAGDDDVVEQAQE